MAFENVRFSDETRKAYAAKLEAVGANGPCLRCGNNKMILWQNYFQLIGAAKPQGAGDVMFEGIAGVPFVAACCPKCGWLALHSVQVLGLPKT